ncbi:MAG TPA: oligosaccharide flippase family protein [Ignavibacteriaceae bacterium]|nr:oligosaccharide flippase family protein [Ignavibacteriaceae bacterium]
MFLFNDIIFLFKQKRNDLPVSEILWVIAGQTLNLILGFAIIKILSRMGTESYGNYALIITFAALLGLIFYGPLQQGFIRFYYVYSAKGLAKVYSSLLINILLISFFVFILIAIAIGLLKDFIAIPFSFLFVLAASAFVIISKISETFNSLLNLLRKRKENAIIQTLEKILQVILLLVLLNQKRLLLVEVISLLLFTSIVFGILKMILFRKFLPEEKKSSSENLTNGKNEMRRTTFAYIIPFLIWGISGWLQSNSERWIISGLLSVSDVGVYAIMMSIVNALVAIPNNMIAEFATPIIFQHYSDITDKTKIKAGFRYISLITFVVFILSIFSAAITFFIGKTFIELISSKSYSGYWQLLPFLCLGTGLYLTGQAQAYLGMALNLPQKYLLPKILIGVFSIVFNFIFIKAFGINGIAYTILITGLLYLLHISFINKKIISEHHL